MGGSNADIDFMILFAIMMNNFSDTHPDSLRKLKEYDDDGESFSKSNDDDNNDQNVQNNNINLNEIVLSNVDEILTGFPDESSVQSDEDLVTAFEAYHGPTSLDESEDIFNDTMLSDDSYLGGGGLQQDPSITLGRSSETETEDDEERELDEELENLPDDWIDDNDQGYIILTVGEEEFLEIEKVTTRFKLLCKN